MPRNDRRNGNIDNNRGTAGMTGSNWQTVGSRYLFKSPYFDVRQDQVTLPGGDRITYTMIEHPGYAMVVPLCADGRVVMEHVYRHPLRRTLLECPSGGLDGQPPDVAARRELEEETGFRATHLAGLGRYAGSSGISNEYFDLFLATDLDPNGQLCHEATEQIEIELIALHQLQRMVINGKIEHGPSALAILLAWATTRT